MLRIKDGNAVAGANHQYEDELGHPTAVRLINP